MKKIILLYFICSFSNMRKDGIFLQMKKRMEQVL